MPIPEAGNLNAGIGSERRVPDTIDERMNLVLI